MINDWFFWVTTIAWLCFIGYIIWILRRTYLEARTRARAAKQELLKNDKGIR